MNDKRGFSLPELLAVITILGILLIVAVPSIGKLKDEIEKKRIKGDAETFLALAKDYSESNANVEGDTIEILLSNIDSSKLNGKYDVDKSSVSGSNCHLSGIRYKCDNFSLSLESDTYIATKNVSSDVIEVRRK